MQLGQADGIACRTTEMLQGFGLVDTLLAEAYWVNETSFWQPSTADPSARSSALAECRTPPTG